MRTMPFMLAPDATRRSAAAAAVTATLSARRCSSAVPGSATAVSFAASENVSCASSLSSPSNAPTCSSEIGGSVSPCSEDESCPASAPARRSPALHGFAAASSGVDEPPRWDGLSSSSESRLHGSRDLPPPCLDQDADGVALDEGVPTGTVLPLLTPPSSDFRPSRDRRPTRNPRNAFATASLAAACCFLATSPSLAYRCGFMPRWP
mmetsp:Transcript_1555/g.5332  ORF Transcript_1555/g.5332 Transcript_1555/m.5332 type:complete len:207 (+) Transcript_1555:3484-4104(+)